MKFTHFVLIAVLAGLSGQQAFGQSRNKATLDIWVGGCCVECSERIESTMDYPGIRKASYNLENHMLHLVYNPQKIGEREIHERLNAAGHDTGESICSEEEYGQLDACCRYREKGIVKKR